MISDYAMFRHSKFQFSEQTLINIFVCLEIVATSVDKKAKKIASFEWAVAVYGAFLALSIVLTIFVLSYVRLKKQSFRK